MTRRVRTLTLIAAVLAGCARRDAPAPAADRPAATTSTTSQSATPTPSLLHALEASDEAALARVHLTTDDVARATQASLNIARLGATDPQLLKRLDQEAPLTDAETLQQAADRLASIPQIRNAIERARLSPRDYVLVSYTIAQAEIATARPRERATTAPDVVSTDNLAFVAAHHAEIQRFRQAVRAMAPRDSTDRGVEP
ncbi:MAG TPA: hypothetical protein VFK13_07795 [Gemmatimonadaceae bacterium]|nr:hypothetical protein [Gemmatimonadaceae bacterium]